MLNALKVVVKAALVAALVVVVGVASHNHGISKGKAAIQRHAVAAGVGAHLLDIENGQIVFCWLTPFGPVPYRASHGLESHGVKTEAVVSPAKKCEECCPCCDCGCQKGGPCDCKEKGGCPCKKHSDQELPNDCGPCCG